MPPAPHPPALHSLVSRRPGAEKIRAVAALRRDLGSRLRPGNAPTTPPALLPTGLVPLDRLLGGGFPRGRLCEIAGRTGSGRTTLALALLASATGAGETVAVVDAADAFDPHTAAGMGVELARVLWLRPPSPRQALRGTERLLEARGFGLVLLDLSGAGQRHAQPAGRRQHEARPGPVDPPKGAPGHPARDGPAAASCIRLARRAAAAGTTLVLLASERLTGTFAEVAVETYPLRARFAGPPDWLEGIEVRVVLARSRSRPTGGSVALPPRGEPARGSP